ncbi:MAG TPA: hypothetical protein DCW90_23095 [Lachnospiraceae bacterium]|nr:hypothetical protein [Lachnospiraceae bacterium]
MAIDPAFGVDNFLQAKFYNETETVANNFMTLLFGKPGFFPSIPYLGLDIPNRLYTTVDSETIQGLKNEVRRQCEELIDFVDDGSFDIQLTFIKEQPVLVFILPIVEKDCTKHFAVGIKTDDLGSVSYNFTWLED